MTSEIVCFHKHWNNASRTPSCPFMAPTPSKQGISAPFHAMLFHCHKVRIPQDSLHVFLQCCTEFLGCFGPICVFLFLFLFLFLQVLCVDTIHAFVLNHHKPIKRHGGGPLKLTTWKRYASLVLSLQCILSQNVLQDLTIIYESEVFFPKNSPFSMPLLPVMLQSIF